MTSDPVRPPFHHELHVALSAAAEGASLILAREGASAVREKERADLVTAVDEAVERLVTERLRSAFPDDAVVAEEFSASAGGQPRRWILDPVDGTTNFVHGHPFVCVSLALEDEEGLAVAVIHAPYLGEVYHALRGGGAFLNGTPIRVSSAASLRESLLATGFPFKQGKGDLDEYMRMVAASIRAARDVRRAGSAALDLAFVAAGRVDAYFETGLAAWDLAAGMLLVREAGGRISGWPGDSGAPLGTGRVVASNGAIHDQMLDVLAPWVDRIA
jgi:myo-inositol-1(or 4)-monophosphatase